MSYAIRKKIEPHIYTFVEEEGTLDELHKTKAYQLRSKINNGGKLTKDEKHWLTDELNTSIWSKMSVAIHGYAIYFDDIISKYLIEYNQQYYAIYGVDKTSVRKYLKEHYKQGSAVIRKFQKDGSIK
jgi:hypothetical protein